MVLFSSKDEMCGAAQQSDLQVLVHLIKELQKAVRNNTLCATHVMYVILSCSGKEWKSCCSTSSSGELCCHWARHVNTPPVTA